MSAATVVGGGGQKPHFPAAVLSTLYQQRASAVYGVPWLAAAGGGWGVWGGWGGCEAAK